MITLSDYKTDTFGVKNVEIQEKEMKKAAKKYKARKFPINNGILEYAKEVNEMAKKVLVKDKYHRQIFMLHSPLKGWEVIDVEVQDKTSKFILMSQLAKNVKENGVEAIIHISEAWITQYSKSEGETIGRREALGVTVIGKNSLEKSYLTFFKRGLFGQIILSETEISNNTKGLNYLNPIIRVWDEN